MLFSMLLLRTPLSIEARGNKGYQPSIKKEAKARYRDEPLDSEKSVYKNRVVCSKEKWTRC
jgi:hypothetical protein